MVLTFSFAVLAQGGGKAEPLKIEFKRGAKSAVVGETIRSGEEWDFVFAARAGQKISLKISSTPIDKSAAFRVFWDETGYAEKS